MNRRDLLKLLGITAASLPFVTAMKLVPEAQAVPTSVPPPIRQWPPPVEFPAARFVRLYSGPMPATADSPPTGTLLAEVDLRDADQTGHIEMTGEVGYARAVTEGREAILDADCGDMWSDAAVRFDTPEFIYGGTVTLHDFRIDYV